VSVFHLNSNVRDFGIMKDLNYLVPFVASALTPQTNHTTKCIQFTTS